MRNKVYLIRGWLNLSAKITVAEFERINVDHVLLITALRRPQFLPPDADMDPNSLMIHYRKLMDHWKLIEQSHALTAEYASVVIDHGAADVRAVEGDPLRIDWFYDTVKAMHKMFGQNVVEVEVLYPSVNGNRVKVDGEPMTLELAIDRLAPANFFG